MIAKFVGGSMDGKTLEREMLARIHLVSLLKQTATADDFHLIDLDVVHGHKVRSEFEMQRYRRVSYDVASNTATYEYDGMEER